MNNILIILIREFRADYRNPYLLSGAGLFMVASVFVAYTAIRRVHEIPVWVALYWLVALFTAFNAISRSFMYESRGRMMYWFTLVKPVQYILAKSIYHILVMALLGAIGAVIYITLFPLKVEDVVMFCVSILLGSTALGSVLSLFGSIASKAGGNFTLLAILGLPVLLPVLMVATTLMKNSIDGLDWSVQWKYLIVLAGLNVVSLGLSVLLFPYLWRE
ncbi:MAG: hypothetical protein Kow0075_07280 [Salibacteraceae bacterium]